MRQQREKRTEDGEQEAVIQWAALMRNAHPELLNLYHVPNEGKRSKAEAARQQRLGLRRGVPDLILDYPKGISGKPPTRPPTPQQCRTACGSTAAKTR